MNKLTYKEAYDKIIQAYFKDEIEPYEGNFCFCGTLVGFLDYDDDSPNYRGWPTDFYSDKQLAKMEMALLSSIRNGVGGKGSIYNPLNGPIWDDGRKSVKEHPSYEDALFTGMCAALDVLKEIHRSRGEDVDGLEVPAFTKRQLQKV